ncbi:MAG: SpoIIIAH-like family protein [Christensenellaceae bacterium]|jgi:stage III sporulation protein AH|nr:SpoIIIAH-like family protein [Christensenellaceae bacterium]
MKLKASKKKIIALASMVVLLVTTGVLNYFLNVRQPIDDIVTPTGETTLTFFESTRLNRTDLRSEQIAILNEIIEANISSADVKEAEVELIAITKMMETELLLENLIMAKGFADVIVAISPKIVNVVVGKENMSVEDAARIFEVIVSQTDYEAKDIQIVPYS